MPKFHQHNHEPARNHSKGKQKFFATKQHRKSTGENIALPALTQAHQLESATLSQLVFLYSALQNIVANTPAVHTNFMP